MPDFKIGRTLALKVRFRLFWEYTYQCGRKVLRALVLARHPQPAQAYSADSLVDLATLDQRLDDAVELRERAPGPERIQVLDGAIVV